MLRWYTGICNFVKIGAASTFIKRGTEVYEITLRTGSSVEDQSYNLVDAKAAYSLIGQNVPANSEYVAETYQNNSKVDNWVIRKKCKRRILFFYSHQVKSSIAKC